jgi:hypothetical protein
MKDVEQFFSSTENIFLRDGSTWAFHHHTARLTVKDECELNNKSHEGFHNFTFVAVVRNDENCENFTGK